MEIAATQGRVVTLVAQETSAAREARATQEMREQTETRVMRERAQPLVTQETREQLVTPARRATREIQGMTAALHRLTGQEKLVTQEAQEAQERPTQGTVINRYV